ncbi:D-alanyl-D-alanine carboxypeptidase [Candidatus Microgenomates bacterium]|nr:D-alanyl-D-alanine carboxypeptidase [Candidatus Microgenomates bacterium]
MRKKNTSRRKFKKSKKDWFRISVGVSTFFILLFLPGQNVYEQPLTFKRQATAQIANVFPTPALYPVNLTGSFPQDLTAQGALAVDLPSGTILYQKNKDLKLSPASTTKIMTALVALDSFDLDQVLTVKTAEQEGRIMGLVSSEKMTAENLLYGALVHSANDAALTLAENYPGGERAFIKKMNEKAEEFNLQNTHFENSIGFESSGQHSSAFDLYILTVKALQNKTFAKIVGTPSITVHDQEFKYFHFLQNVNELLGKVPGVAGIKTGFTETAGECLVNLTKKGEREVVTVILKSEDRFGETERLLDWVFLNHRWEEITPASR